MNLRVIIRNWNYNICANKTKNRNSIYVCTYLCRASIKFSILIASLQLSFIYIRFSVSSGYTYIFFNYFFLNKFISETCQIRLASHCPPGVRHQAPERRERPVPLSSSRDKINPRCSPSLRIQLAGHSQLFNTIGPTRSEV